MVQEVIFHIGDHKTGSTSIQNALAVGVSSSPTIFYPTDLNHNYLADLVKKPQQNNSTPRRNPKHQGKFSSFQELATAISNSDADICILSGETFENISAEKFKQTIVSQFGALAQKVRVVAYVRPHANRILSSYAEQIKIGWFQGDLSSFVNRAISTGRFEYAPRFSDWKTQFGDQFELRPMIKERLHNNDVVYDFLKVALRSEDFQIPEGITSNESLTVEDLAFIRELQVQINSKGKWIHHSFGWEMSRLLSKHTASGSGKKLGLPKSEAQIISDTFMQDAKLVDAKFFGDEPILENSLIQAITNAIPEMQSLDLDDNFSPDETKRLRAVAELIGELSEITPKKWPPLFGDQRRNDILRIRDGS